VKYR